MGLRTVFRPTRKRVAVLGAIAGVSALTLAVTTPASAAKAEHRAAGKKPTAYVRSVLASVKGPVVLVGHSYGGAVISEAATGDPQVKALVYIAAFLPEKGESALELSNKFPGSTLGENLNPVSFPLAGGGTGTDLYIKADKFHDQFAADVPRATTDLMAATQRPIAAGALEEKATGAAWKTIPSFDLVTTGDKNIPPAAQRFMAERAHAHTVEIDASHAVSVSRPAAVTRLIEQAARSTTR
ncbi:alpha/beta hydrolase [Streptomyces sp. NRRL WC-3725]|uniref:alpha/beta hydrolase n=1 Tax=Streptomyces sp. NRRL WC-3725 TaxID=1463933 RepID=UPI0004C929A4|nr:alpha/beta hydrolase [Streptomyces sp. NRRL WC-3725]